MVGGTRRIAHQGLRVVVPLYEAQQILASCDTIGEEDRIGRSRDTRKEVEHGKKGGGPRISQCLLEERENGNWEIDDEDLEAN